MSWITTALVRLRAAMRAAGSGATSPTAGPRAIGTAMQTSSRKLQPKLMGQPKVLSGALDRGTTTNAEYLAWQMAWEKFGEQPSPHQRLAPYA